MNQLLRDLEYMRDNPPSHPVDVYGYVYSSFPCACPKCTQARVDAAPAARVGSPPVSSSKKCVPWVEWLSDEALVAEARRRGYEVNVAIRKGE